MINQPPTTKARNTLPAATPVIVTPVAPIRAPDSPLVRGILRAARAIGQPAQSVDPVLAVLGDLRDRLDTLVQTMAPSPSGPAQALVPLEAVGVGTTTSMTFRRMDNVMVVEAIPSGASPSATITVLDCPIGGTPQPALDPQSVKLAGGYLKYALDGLQDELTLQINVTSGVWSVRVAFQSNTPGARGSPAAATFVTRGYWNVDSSPAYGTATAPLAGAAIATIAAPVAGTYEINVVVGFGTTVAAADIDNYQLRHGSTVVGTIPATPAANTTMAVVRLPRVTVAAGENITINAINGGSAGSNYRAQLVATRVV